jgi:methylated-DNA-[protein]-cysteine S-methyltransferase
MYESAALQVRDGFSLWIETGPQGIRKIEFANDTPSQSAHSPLMRETLRQLRAYFSGELHRFDLPLDLVGTEFQQRVWRALQTIPYGETRSYSQIAAQIEAPRAVRAVGAANGRNPIPIVVPCHRVIGASGDLVGFGGGLDWKRLLLTLETKNAERFRQATA